MRFIAIMLAAVIQALAPAHGQTGGADSTATAHHCLSVIKDGLYGGFTNSCSYAVDFLYCNYRAKDGVAGWSESFDCEAKKGGLARVPANDRITLHTNNAQWVYWFACRADTSSIGPTEFVPGQGIVGQCHSSEARDSDPASQNKPAPIALPSQPSSGFDGLFQQGIAQAQQDERDRPAREAREKAERERLDREAKARELARLDAEKRERERPQPVPVQGQPQKEPGGACGRADMTMSELARNAKSAGYAGDLNRFCVCIAGRMFDAHKCGCLRPNTRGCRG